MSNPRHPRPHLPLRHAQRHAQPASPPTPTHASHGLDVPFGVIWTRRL